MARHKHYQLLPIECSQRWNTLQTVPLPTQVQFVPCHRCGSVFSQYRPENVLCSPCYRQVTHYRRELMELKSA